MSDVGLEWLPTCNPKLKDSHAITHDATTLKRPRPTACCSCAAEIFNFRPIRSDSIARNFILQPRVRCRTVAPGQYMLLEQSFSNDASKANNSPGNASSSHLFNNCTAEGRILLNSSVASSWWGKFTSSNILLLDILASSQIITSRAFTLSRINEFPRDLSTSWRQGNPAVERP